RCDGIAVIVAHHLSLGAKAAGAALRALAGIEREQVHGAVVKGSLLGLIAVVLVGGRRLGAIEAEGSAASAPFLVLVALPLPVNRPAAARVFTQSLPFRPGVFGSAV